MLQRKALELVRVKAPGVGFVPRGPSLCTPSPYELLLSGSEFPEVDMMCCLLCRSAHRSASCIILMQPKVSVTPPANAARYAKLVGSDPC